MSRWAQNRKFLIIFVFGCTTAIVIATTLFFVFWKKASCSDGILNQDEQGVDCGGVCELPENGAKFCKVIPFKIGPVWYRAFRLTTDDYTDNIYNAVALMQNQNTDIIVRRAHYEFIFL